jgi:hypothetical protein
MPSHKTDAPQLPKPNWKMQHSVQVELEVEIVSVRYLMLPISHGVRRRHGRFLVAAQRLQERDREVREEPLFFVCMRVGTERNLPSRSEWRLSRWAGCADERWNDTQDGESKHHHERWEDSAADVYDES